MTRVLIACGLVAAGLTAVIGFEAQSALRSQGADPPVQRIKAGLGAGAAATALADPVETWVTTALERPLLREGRRPDKAGSELARKADDMLRLAAVMTGPFGDRAIFILPGSTKPVIAKVGARVGDFVVQSIEPGRVVVDVDGKSKTYRPLYALKPPKRA